MKKKSLKKLVFQKKAIASLHSTNGGAIAIGITGAPGSICEPKSLCNTQCQTLCELTICHHNCLITANPDVCGVNQPTPMNL